MRVAHRGVAVRVRVRLARRVVGAVRVLVVFVVNVRVFVNRLLVAVFVVVPFGQVKPHTQSHQPAGRDERPRHPSRKTRRDTAAPTNGAVEK